MMNPKIEKNSRINGMAVRRPSKLNALAMNNTLSRHAVTKKRRNRGPRGSRWAGCSLVDGVVVIDLRV